MFAPIVIAWLLCISGIGIYNIYRWNPSIFRALSPVYMYRFLRSTGVEGWVSLGGVVLCITGSETMFANLGHFSPLSIKIAFTFLVYPCLILAYMGEAAFLSKHHDDIQRSFYKAIPGLAVTTVFFTTTFLMSLVIIIVWKQNILNAITFLVIFGSIELLYISASFIKIPEGGWIPLILSMMFMTIMYVWNYGTLKKHEFALENKVSVQRILALGPNLGIVRVPGIGLVYADLVTGVPAVFGHFATNLPAFHQVLVFVCIKSVQVPYVSEEERFLVGRIGPKDFHIFRCIVRYGYKELQQDNCDFENILVLKIIAFVETEEDKQYCEFGSSDDECIDVSCNVDGLRKDESMDILKAKESGVVYILGRPIAKTKKSSSVIKKFAINFVYSFLNRNCREPDVMLKVPHSLLLEVGMVYYV